MRLLLGLVLLLALLFDATAARAGKCVYVVGDLHGDFDALVAILEEAGLIDPTTGVWIGKDCEFYVLGDLISRWHDGRLINDYLSELVRQGAGIHRLVGNHEVKILQGELEYVSRQDLVQWRDWKWFYFDSLTDAYQRAMSSPRSPYALELATRPTLVRVHRSLLLHAGLTKKALAFDLDTINRRIREEVILPLQRREKGSQDEFLHEVLWDRTMALGQQPEKDIVALLAHFDVDRFLIGHTTSEWGRIEEVYGGKVVRVDARLSRGMDAPFNILFFVKLEEDGRVVRRFAGRPRGAHPLRETLVGALRNRSCPRRLLDNATPRR